LTGVLVTEVKDGSWAAVGELQANDIIQTVNDQPVTEITALETTMKSVAKQRPKFVVLRVVRGVHTRYLELEPSWDNTK